MTEQIVERSELLETPLIPEYFARRYREEGYWIDQTIPEFLLDACRAKPHFRMHRATQRANRSRFD